VERRGQRVLDEVEAAVGEVLARDAPGRTNCAAAAPPRVGAQRGCVSNT
jgi:hypothetical protein